MSQILPSPFLGVLLPRTVTVIICSTSSGCKEWRDQREPRSPERVRAGPPRRLGAHGIYLAASNIRPACINHLPSSNHMTRFYRPTPYLGRCVKGNFHV